MERHEASKYVQVKKEQNFDFVNLNDPNLFMDDTSTQIKIEIDEEDEETRPQERNKSIHQKENFVKKYDDVVEKSNANETNDKKSGFDEKNFKFNGVSVPIEIKSEAIYLKYRDAKVFCRKCGEAFSHKSDLFNHMFLHIDIILAEAEFIKSLRKIEVKESEVILPSNGMQPCHEDNAKAQPYDCDDDTFKDDIDNDEDYDYFGDVEDGDQNRITGMPIKEDIKVEIDSEKYKIEDNQPMDVISKSTDEIKTEAERSGKNKRKEKNINKGEKKKLKTKENKLKSKEMKLKTKEMKLKTKENKLKIKEIKSKTKDGHERRRRKKGELPKVYECNDCSYKSMELWAMRKHCVIHLPNNPFKCSLCDFSCKTRFSLKSHFSRHTGEKNYKCEHCGTSFRTRSIWARHIEIHNEKNHTCHICAKKFYRGDSLRYHLLTHSEQRPYKCHLCPYGAKHPKTLKIHVDNHDEVKKYTCPQCDFRTSRRSTITKHFQVHNTEAQYKCQHCSFTCRALTTLKKHSEVHMTNAQVFSCTECDFMSTVERAVMRHLRQHQNIPLKVLQMKVKAMNRDVLRL